MKIKYSSRWCFPECKPFFRIKIGQLWGKLWILVAKNGVTFYVLCWISIQHGMLGTNQTHHFVQYYFIFHSRNFILGNCYRGQVIKAIVAKNWVTFYVLCWISIQHGMLGTNQTHHFVQYYFIFHSCDFILGNCFRGQVIKTIVGSNN